MTLARAVGELYRLAPGEVRMLALLALLTGGLGLALALYWAGAMLVLRGDARRSRAEGPVGLEVRTLPAALGRLLGPFGDPSTIAVTPDAVWAGASARLVNQFDEMRMVVKFLTYLPLLIGLAATMLGLSQLVGDLGTQMTDASRGALRGVFLGTLSGILGSFVAGIGGILLGRSGAVAAVAVDDYVQLCILPAIPERRIGVKIEEAVLEVIAAKSLAVADHLRSSITPVAERLTESAAQSAASAVAAREALEHAAGVVTRAGDITKAAKIIGAHISKLEDAASSIARAADAAREATGIEDQLRSRLIEAVQRSQSESDRVLETGKALGQRIDELKTPVEGFSAASQRFAGTTARLESEIFALRDSFSGLAAQVQARNELERAHIDSLEAQLQGLGVPLDSLKGALVEIGHQLSSIGDEGKALRGATESFSRHASDDIATELNRHFTALSGSLRDVLTEISSIIPQSKGHLEEAGRGIRDVVREVREQVPEMARALEPTAVAVRRYGDELHAIGERLGDLNSSLERAQSSLSHALPAPPESSGAGERAARELEAASIDMRRAVQGLVRMIPPERQMPQAGASGRPHWWKWRR